MNRLSPPRGTFCLTVVLAVLGLVTAGFTAAAQTPIEQLGEFLYFDDNLSEPAGQACASCHLPSAGFTDPDQNLPVSEGVIPGRFGGRNSPISAYAMFAPTFYFDTVEGLWIGGQFWDGRATGYVLGDPLADQALGPFLNPVEMNNPSKATVIADIAASPYADLFKQVWGNGSLNNVERAYDRVALSIAAFERTATFAAFDSKYDAYLADCVTAGIDMNECATGASKRTRKYLNKYFTPQERRGMDLFMGVNNNDGILDKGEGAMCSACHVADWTPDPGNVSVPAWAPVGFVPPVFTDFTFDNLGIPQNTEYPLDPNAAPDLGLGAFLESFYGASVDYVAEYGKFKVMTVRNIGLSAPYGHNGLFKTLKEIVHFYNTRDVPGALPGGQNWPPPEWPATVNFNELGNLGLSDKDEDDLVEFLKTLNDGWRP